MIIYVAHSKKINYKEDLYNPIRKDRKLEKYHIILPHEASDKSYNTREFYKSLSVIIAEVSNAGTGLGIELGWAFDDGIPIYCIYKKESKIASSLKFVTDKFFEYESPKELVAIIEKIIFDLEIKEEKNQ